MLFNNQQLENKSESKIVEDEVVVSSFSAGPRPSHQCAEVPGLGGWVGNQNTFFIEIQRFSKLTTSSLLEFLPRKLM